MQKLINFLRGSVRLEVTGAFPERFLNLCAQAGIGFWELEWPDGTTLRLRDGTRLPIGRRYYQAFQSAFIHYLNQTTERQN